MEADGGKEIIKGHGLAFVHCDVIGKRVRTFGKIFRVDLVKLDHAIEPFDRGLARDDEHVSLGFALLLQKAM